MSVKSSTELMLYVVLTMPTLNKAYLLFIYIIIKIKNLSPNFTSNTFHDLKDEKITNLPTRFNNKFG
jgi:hypothetical protein